MITRCEVKQDGEWVEIGFVEAVKRRGQARSGLRMRCPACGGRVTPYQSGGTIPHFGHLARHEHCPLAHDFSGAPALHPDALS